MNSFFKSLGEARTAGEQNKRNEAMALADELKGYYAQVAFLRTASLNAKLAEAAVICSPTATVDEKNVATHSRKIAEKALNDFRALIRVTESAARTTCPQHFGWC